MGWAITQHTRNAPKSNLTHPSFAKRIAVTHAFCFTYSGPQSRSGSSVLTPVPYSGKIWRPINLAKWRKKGCILILAKFINFCDW